MRDRLQKVPTAKDDDLKAAIRSALGTPDVLARAYKVPPDKQESLYGQYDAVVDELAAWCAAQGLDSSEKIRQYCRKASRADFGHTYLNFLRACSASYGAAGILLWVGSVIAGLIFPPAMAIVIPGLIALGFFWKYGVHALCAGAGIGTQMSRSIRPDGTSRCRFTLVARPKTMKGAWGRELVAQAPGTTASVAFTVALKLLLGFVQSVPAWLSFLGSPLMTVVGTAFAPLAFCLRDLMDKRTHAPLFGVAVDANGTMTFDSRQAVANRQRLDQPAAVRTMRTIADFAHSYRKNFAKSFRDEQSKGMTRHKAIEFVFGGLPMSVGALSALGLLTINSSAGVSTIVSAARSAGVSATTVALTNPLTSSRVLDHAESKFTSNQRAKNPAPRRADPARTDSRQRAR
ncbi:hypothetical protein [Trinickia acidisoli]|uniref:hypothetical protein n=1 Tax=Trinickia acidisoli TaxID=2767482 RepID=UPI001A90B4FF|nr:hypothetical protein [Trinickia acidisoli]